MARSTAKPSQKNARARKARRASTSLEPAMHAGKKRPIDLYYWPTPNGWKITIMLEECSLPYTMIPVDISKGDQFKPFWQSRPTTACRRSSITTAPTAGRSRSSSLAAILQYLGRKTGKFYPRDERGRVEVDQWLFWQMANLGPKAGE